MNESLAIFVKDMRKKFGLTQVDLAAKSGVGLRFVRELEQGKITLRLDKVNQELALFGHEVGVVPQLDLVNFWELVGFSWITGNADMHLKNFSIIPDWATASHRLTTCSSWPSSCPRTVQASHPEAGVDAPVRLNFS